MSERETQRLYLYYILFTAYGILLILFDIDDLNNVKEKHPKIHYGKLFLSFKM